MCLSPSPQTVWKRLCRLMSRQATTSVLIAALGTWATVGSAVPLCSTAVAQGDRLRTPPVEPAEPAPPDPPEPLADADDRALPKPTPDAAARQLAPAKSNPASRDKPAPTDEQIAAWIRDLDADSFAVREEAMRRLIAAGAPAVAPVARAVSGASAEASWRAMVVLRSLGVQEDPLRLDAVIAALARVAQSPDHPAAGRAGELIRHWESSRNKRIMAYFQSRGAQVGNERGAVASLRIPADWPDGEVWLPVLALCDKVRLLRLESPAVDDDAMRYLDGLAQLQSLHLRGTEVHGAGLAHLRYLGELRFLSLQGLPLDDAAFDALAELTQLAQLGLDDTPATDANLARLRRLANLKTLWLNGTRITDAGLAELAHLKDLNRLVFTGTAILGPGIEHLKHLPQLKYVSFQHVALDDDAMQYVALLRQLETLGLDDTKIGDAGVARLRDMTTLQVLWLTNTSVTDAAIDDLATLKGLKMLHLKGTKITDEGAQALAEKLPGCRIER